MVKEISLLPQERFRKSPIGRLSFWLVSVGRYIIVFTELIVVSAFLSRFYLDRKNADLSEKIRQQKAILASVSDFENDYLLFQKRLKLIESKMELEENFAEPLRTIASHLHPDVLISSYSYIRDKNLPVISLTTESFSVTGVSYFVNSLSGDPQIDVVKLEGVNKERNKKIEARLTVHFKDKEAQNGSK